MKLRRGNGWSLWGSTPGLRERLLWLGGGVLLGSALAAAVSVAAEPEPDTVYRKLQILAEVISHIESYYVDPVSPAALVYGANRGAVATLDPHSMFFSPEEYRELLDTTEGEYAGIGVEIELNNGAAEVIAALDGSPAALAGVRRGDRIVVIDAHDLGDATFDDVQRLIRGPVGTQLVLEIERPGSDRRLTFTLLRAWIRVAPLASAPLGDGLFRVQMKTFPRRVAADLEHMLGDLGPKGLVLDLRNNPGGLFDEAIDVCDLFLDDGPIVTAVGRAGQQVEQRTARPHSPQAHLPLAILIDGGSASASEVVAGALRDRGRARLFGSRSYGKGTVQTILDLSDGSGLKLTIARYITPSGRQIDGHGIEPDESFHGQSTKDEALAAAVTWLKKQH